MKTPFAPFLHLICTVLAAALLLVLSASAGDLAVRVIDRSPDVRNLDTTDTLKWYADESIDYTVRPRRGKEAVSIPGDAVATWIIADPATGTNYLSAVAASQTSNSVTFHLPLGGAALPEGVDEWVSFVSLLQGTNFLGVIDRTRAECLWSPYTSAAALVPTNPLPELLRQFATTNYVAAALAPIEHDIQGIAGDLAHQAEDIAAIEEAVAAADSRIDGLWGEMPGGWRYPDYFSALARVGGEPAESVALSTNTTINAVETLRQTTSVRGWLLEAVVTRQSEFGKGVEWELGPGAEGLWRIEGGTVVPDGATFDNVATGDVFHATGRLGDFERNLVLTVTGDNVSSSGQWQWDGWGGGSLIRRNQDYSEGFADYYSNRTSHTRTWPEGYGSGTEHVPAGWANTWVPKPNHAFSCVSYHTDTPSGIAGGPYRPLTLVTPRHAVCANHWKPTLGSNVYWVGASGAIYTNQVIAYKNLRGDLTVARLAEPMNAMFEDSEVVRDLMLPYLLPEDYEYWFYGCEHGGAGCPGVPCVSLNWVEMAYMTYWRCAPALTAKRASDPRSFTVRARGAGTPHGRQAAAVGGDSGSPTFLLMNNAVIHATGPYATERPVLLGCFHWASTPETGIGTAGGPIPLAGEVNAAIEEWGDEERAESAEACFEACGYEKYNPGMEPW